MYDTTCLTRGYLDLPDMLLRTVNRCSLNAPGRTRLCGLFSRNRPLTSAFRPSLAGQIFQTSLWGTHTLSSRWLQFSGTAPSASQGQEPPTERTSHSPSGPVPGEQDFNEGMALLVRYKPACIASFEKSASLGYPPAYVMLFSIYSGVLDLGPSSRDESKRDHYFSQAAGAIDHFQQGVITSTDPDAHYLLASCYDNGIGVVKDEAAAAKHYEVAADQRHPLAQLQLSFLYSVGDGVDADDNMAFRYMKASADQGFALAQVMMGAFLENGEGTTPNPTAAFKYYQRAVDQGHVGAHLSLGFCYGNGMGVKQNDKIAFKLIQTAANEGLLSAKVALAGCYMEGKGVKKSESLAFGIFKAAADEGDDQAQFCTGGCLASGKGVPKNEKAALQYLELASEQGNEHAQHVMSTLREQVKKETPNK